MTDTQFNKQIEVTRDGPVGVIRINRPERKNAMTADMFQEFSDRLKEQASDNGVRAVVVTGTGDVFLSGADVGKVTASVGEMSPADWRDVRDLFQEQFWALYSMQKPTIAAINGAAVVTGIEVALSCDIRIASDQSRYRVGFRRMALMPTPIICYMLPHVIGPGRAKLMAFTNRFFDAAEAERMGLVDIVVPHDKLMDEAMSLAHELASGPTMMIASTKVAMNQSFNLDFDVLRRQIDGMQYTLTRTEDYQEAMAAFAERRDPNYKGR
jgi:2-(1,2-epoxy-1,2-dihydrophenyl)acetyl-CoA isomerase